MGTSPPRDAKTAVAGGPRKGIKTVKRYVRRYRRPPADASRLHLEELSDYLSFADHILRTDSRRLLPMARRCLELGADILREETISR